MAVTHSLMLIHYHLVIVEEEKLTSQTFSRREVTESSPSLIIPHWHLDGSASPSMPSCQGWMFFQHSWQRRDFICMPQAWQQRTGQQFQCFHTKPFNANQDWVQEKNGRGEDLWKSSSSQALSQLETSFCFSLFHGRTIERALLKALLVHLCSEISHYEYVV